MKVNLISIGNSKGVRIPSTVIKECGFADQVDMRVEGGTVVISPLRAPREGWNDAYGGLASEDDEEPLLTDDLQHDWDDEEWEW